MRRPPLKPLDRRAVQYDPKAFRRPRTPPPAATPAPGLGRRLAIAACVAFAVAFALRACA